jgi:hypothetical protein
VADGLAMHRDRGNRAGRIRKQGGHALGIAGRKLVRGKCLAFDFVARP